MTVVGVSLRLVRDIVLQPVLLIAGILYACYLFMTKKVMSWEIRYHDKFKVHFIFIKLNRKISDVREGVCLSRFIFIENPDFDINGNQISTSYNTKLIEELYEHETNHFIQEIYLSYLFLILYPYSYLICKIYKIPYRDHWFEK